MSNVSMGLGDPRTLASEVHQSAEQLAAPDILKILWQGRTSLFAITGVIAAIVTAAALLLPAKYEATVLMMPVTDMESEDRGSGSSISQLGGLASLAGLGSSGNSLKAEAVATLESEALTDRYIQDNDLLPVLYSDRWDAVRRAWKVSGRNVPTLWRANRYFRGIRSVTENAKTGLIAMTITWRDPSQTAKWANDLVNLTNDYLRKKAVAESERNIAFLNEQAKKESVVSLQAAISSLTENQLRKMMLAQGRQQFALKVIDPATVPERKSFPVPSIWIPAGFFVGLFVGVLYVLLRAPGSAPPPSQRPAPGSSAGI